jgi:hypothetical protein
MTYGVMDFLGVIFIFWLITYLLHMSIGGIISLFWRAVMREQDITIRFK